MCTGVFLVFFTWPDFFTVSWWADLRVFLENAKKLLKSAHLKIKMCSSMVDGGGDRRKMAPR